MTIKKYSFDNGKYEVHAADDGSSLVAYRHGEFWQNMTGDNLTAAMLNRIDDLYGEIQDASAQGYEAGLMDGANQ